MADNNVDIAVIAPFKFVKEGYTQPAKYNTKFLDDYTYEDTIPSFYEKRKYFAPWQKNDATTFQIMSNYQPHQLEVYKLDYEIKIERLVDTLVFANMPVSTDITGMKTYEINVAFNTYDEGIYRMRIQSGSPFIDTMVSEWMHLKELHEGTILIEYTHDENDFDTVFETGLVMSVRVPAMLPPESLTPGATRSIFINQSEGAIELNAVTFDVEKLFIGGTYGVPPYKIKMLNKVIGCRTVMLDGKQYTINEGAKFEPTTSPDYPMAGWVVDVRRTETNNKKRFTADGAQGAPVAAVYNLEMTGFGPITGGASSNLAQIIIN